MSDVRIYQPSKTAMQSGLRRTRHWVVEYERAAPQVNDPLMGWVGSSDTRPQVRLRFPTREEAIEFARRNQLSYRLIEPHQRLIRPKSYAENFRS